MSYTYKYPRPQVTSDCLVFWYDKHITNVLLVTRKNEPFQGKLAFPGGFINLNETLAQCAKRELKEETGLDVVTEHLTFIGLYDAINRDLRHRTITAAFMIELFGPKPEVVGADDAENADWYNVNTIFAENLAFDHHTILLDALEIIL